MKTIIITLVTLLLTFFSGCGYKEGVTTEDTKAYLYFSGDLDDVTVSVDHAEEFKVKAGRDNQYKLKPGKHLIEVYRDGQKIIQREIFLGNGIAKEIEVAE
ncbi:hypothetical protein [Sulfurimonas sp. C5]|uniref:hypothetical protein n=1 Tax=Sulfurimonas sp. C5 TaxID=3036947 RepID=UPI00245849F0|nr:hypothetical protein [Sulfurimonas sp. C5]MDH4944811.1 hypothetical protein [Sulfurimonas sp. C5]